MEMGGYQRVTSWTTPKITFKEYFMAKGSHGSSGGSEGGGHSAPRGGRAGVGFTPSRPGGNIPSKTGKPSGDGRGNLPPKSGEQQGGQ
jgi:hypothetical protein